MEVCQCFGCKLDHFRNNPDQLVKAGEFVEIIDRLVREIDDVKSEIDDVRSEIPREYDPQCD